MLMQNMLILGSINDHNLSFCCSFGDLHEDLILPLLVKMCSDDTMENHVYKSNISFKHAFARKSAFFN